MPDTVRAWRLLAAASLTTLAFVTDAPVIAAEPDASGAPRADEAAGSGLGDIVVTATRRESRLQSTPVAVSVIGEAFRANQNVITTRDLAGQIPGLYTPPSGITPLTNTFFIRGIGNSDPIFDPTVGVYIDDVYLPRAINGMSDLTDVERVEVLRGPQGTLFGANSAGGALRYVTRTPTETFDFRADAGYGNYDTINAHAYVGGRIVPGLLAGSIAVARDQHDGYTWNPSLGTHVNNQRTTGGRIKLVVTPTSSLKVTLSGDGTIDHSQAAQYVPTTYNATNPALSGLGAITDGTFYSPISLAPYQENVTYAGRYPINRSLSGGATGRIDYDFDDHLSLHSITALRAFDQDPVNYNNDGQNRLPYNAAQPRAADISDNYIRYFMAGNAHRLPVRKLRQGPLAIALPYDPETVNTYEAGIKTDWFDRRLRINATGFYNDYSDLHTAVSAFSPISATYVTTRGNAPSAHTQGFELETSAQPVDNLSLAFNVTYLETNYDDYSAPGLGTVPAYNYTGNPDNRYRGLFRSLAVVSGEVPAGRLRGTSTCYPISRTSAPRRCSGSASSCSSLAVLPSSSSLRSSRRSGARSRRHPAADLDAALGQQLLGRVGGLSRTRHP